MTLTTALVWFIVSGSSLQNTYHLGTLGPFVSQTHCMESRKHVSTHIDRGWLGTPFLNHTQCVPLEIVIGPTYKKD